MAQEKITTFDDLFRNGLEYAYDAEKQLTQALPKMAEASSSQELRNAFQQHSQESKQQASRIEQICSKLNITLQNKQNQVVRTMTQEAENIIRNTDPSALRDAALIVVGNQVEHFEMSSYGTLVSFAQQLGHNDIVQALQQVLDEEKNADRRLTQIGESDVNRKALQMRAQPKTAAGSGRG